MKRFTRHFHIKVNNLIDLKSKLLLFRPVTADQVMVLLPEQLNHRENSDLRKG